MMRIAMGIEYDGSRYFGWQRQREVNSIQAELERVLSTIANHPVEIQCAGRTDAGVHATGQVIHFDTHSERKMSAWTLGVNSNLPADIAVRWAHPVADDFHARFSLMRRMDYRRYNGAALLGLRGLVFKSHGSADALAFEQALNRAYDAARNNLLDRVRSRIAHAAPLLASSTAQPALATAAPLP